MQAKVGVMMVENFVIVMWYHLVVVVIHLDYWKKKFLYVLVLIPILKLLWLV
jgi:hypothetical protein